LARGRCGRGRPRLLALAPAAGRPPHRGRGDGHAGGGFM